METTRAQRSRWGLKGALTLHGRGLTNTAPARAAMAEKWLRLADPDGSLTPDVRAKRADYLRRAWLLELSIRAAEARRRKRNRAA